MSFPLRARAGLTLCLLAFVLIGSQVCLGQGTCAAWREGGSIPGVNGPIFAMTSWDPDADGPRPPVLVVGGGIFSAAGSVVANNIAIWDGGGWQALGASQADNGLNGIVYALAVYRGELIAAGQFTRAGNVAANNIARWNGVSWRPLEASVGPAQGVSGIVRALTVFNDELVVGGQFGTAGNVPVRNLARWNGASWNKLGRHEGVPDGVDGPVRAVLGWNNTLVAAGGFSSAGGVNARAIASWTSLDGWRPLVAAGSTTDGVLGEVRALTQLGADLVVCGAFTQAGAESSRNIARFTGLDWVAMPWDTSGDPAGTAISAALVTGTSLYVAGEFSSIAGVPASRVARWTGSAWQPVWGGMGVQGVSGPANSLASFGGEVVVGGVFVQAGTAVVNSVARWKAPVWNPLPAANGDRAVNNTVSALAEYNSDLYVGGYYLSANGQIANSLSRWDGAAWQIVAEQAPGSTPGVGPTGVTGVDTLVSYNSELVVGGSFTTAGGRDARHVVRWDGAQWRTLDGGAGTNGTDGNVQSSAVFQGQLVLGGEFMLAGNVPASRIAAWTPTGFAALSSGMDAPVTALCVYQNMLYAGGSFGLAGGQAASRIARWNGTSWQPVGGGLSSDVKAMAVYNNELVVAGVFWLADGQLAQGLARWNGSTWRTMPASGADIGLSLGASTGQAWSLVVHNNELIVGGLFTAAGGTAANNIAAWNGVSFRPLASGVSSLALALASYSPARGGINGPVLVAGGIFGSAGGKVSPSFAVWGPPTTSIWAAPSGGNLAMPSNWVCAIGPSATQDLLFDRVAAGVNLQQTYSVTTTTPITARRLGVSTDQVTLNLLGSNMILTGGPSIATPPLVVGERPGVPDTRLLCRNTGGAATLTASGLTVGNVADPGNMATFSARDANLTVRVAGSAAVGALSRGVLEVREGATLRYGLDENSFLALGLHPGPTVGTINITDGGRLTAALPIRVLSLGSSVGSEVLVNITGTNSQWTAEQADLQIGDLGLARVSITGGGRLVTTTSNSVHMGRHSTAGAEVTIGAGSSWTESGTSINIGGAGGASRANLTIRSGGLLRANEVNAYQGGELAGAGIVHADVYNSGTVRPGDPVGTMTIEGGYRQIPASPLDPRSGVLAMEIAGTAPGQADVLEVQGTAELGGGLVVTFSGGFLPSAAQPLNVELVRATGLTRFFDVAYFPALPPGDSRSLRTVYNRLGSVSIGTTTLGGALGLLSPAPTSLSGVPTAWALGDINADGKADLTIAVSGEPSQPGSVFVLLNASTGPGNIAFVPGPTQQITVGRVPLGLAIVDVDGDSRADLVVSNSQDNNIRILLQSASGGGVFTGSAIVVGTGHEPMGLCAAPLARTGRMDIAVANRADDSVMVILNDSTPGAPSFSRARTFPVRSSASPGATTPRGPTTVRPCNPDSDKDLDLCVVNTTGSSVTLLESTTLPGDFSVGARVELGVAASPVAVATAPIAGSSGEDCVVACAGSRTVSVVLYDRLQGGFAFRPAVDLPVDVTPVGIVTADLDNAPGFNGLRDVDVGLLGADATGAARARVLRNDFDGTIGQATLALQPNDPAASIGQSPYALVGDNVRRSLVQLTSEYGTDLDLDAVKDLVVLTNSPPPTPSGPGSQSDRGPATPVVRAVRTLPACRPDFNRSGAVTVQDVFDFIAAWFAGCTAPGPGPCIASADFNGVGGVTVQDVFDFLTAWFGGC